MSFFEKLRQHESTAYIACRDLSSPTVKCFLIDPNGYLAPYPAFKAPVLAGVSFAFTLVPVLSIKRLSGLGQP